MKRKDDQMVQNNKKTVALWQFKSLEYISYGLIFLIPLYINSAHWMSISFPKQLLFTGTVCIMIGLFIWGKWKNSYEGFSFTWAHLGMTIFFGILIISGLLGVDPKNSFFGPFQGNLNLITFGTLGIFGAFVGFLICRNNTFLPKIASVSLVSGVIVASITYFGKYVIKLSNDGSTVGNNSYLGAYLLLVVCMSIGIFFWYQKYWQKFLVGLSLAIILISPVFLNRMIWSGAISLDQVIDKPLLLLGGANGATIGIVIAIFVMICLWFTRNKKMIVRIIGGLSFICLIIGIWFGGAMFMNPESGLHKSFIAEKSENRFIWWDIARQGYVDRPLLGYGFNNYSYIYQKYITDKIFKNDRELELWVSRPHNIFWEYVSLSGILGTLAFTSAIGGLFIFFYKKSNQEDRTKKIFGIVFAGTIFGYTFQNLFVFDTLVPLMLLFVIIGAAVGFSEKHYTVQIGQIPKKVILIILSILSIGCLVFLVIQPWRESLRWGKISSGENISKLSEIRKEMQDVSIVGTIEDTSHITDREIKKINEAVPTLTEKTSPVVIHEIDSLITSIEREIDKNPNTYRAHLTAGNLIILRLMIARDQQVPLIQKAVSHFNSAIRLSPINPMSYINMANLYVVIGNNTESYKYLRAAIAVAPTFSDGYVSARSILKIAPNREFEKYLSTMEQRWGMVSSKN